LRRAALVALTFLLFAPAARASCGLVASPVRGAAPLAVTLTATCVSSAYTWDFGDGQTATGQTVQHAFAAGYWHPTLTTDAGTEPVQPVTSIALRLRGPAAARYAQWIVLHATVVPRLPVTLRGRKFIGGELRVRVLGTTPWIAEASGVRSNGVRTRVRPKLVVRVAGTPVVGGKLRVVATLHPANAGRVVAPASISTATPRVARVTVTTKPAPGWARVAQTVAATIVSPALALGDRGPSVRALENRLSEMHYAVKRDGYFGSEDLEAVYAFQKVERLARTGTVDAALWRRLRAARTPFARFGGDHVEIDKTRQVLFVVRGGKVTLVVATSTGATGNTPLGVWHVYRKVGGFDWVLYYPSYFLRGFAVHGYPDVPPYPASHGCARIPMWIAQTVYAQMAGGSTVIVYT
jgi:peptidoglycan hydrolase-like protein with peptidoglycan-binding domain